MSADWYIWQTVLIALKKRFQTQRVWLSFGMFWIQTQSCAQFLDDLDSGSEFGSASGYGPGWSGWSCSSLQAYKGLWWSRLLPPSAHPSCPLLGSSSFLATSGCWPFSSSAPLGRDLGSSGGGSRCGAALWSPHWPAVGSTPPPRRDPSLPAPLLPPFPWSSPGPNYEEDKVRTVLDP